MTATSEWSHVESSMQDLAPSSDLFDGDILGDELMDIYNAAVVGGGEDGLNEIPTLLGSSDGTYGNHPGAQVAETVAAMDDGYGAFRPSTSFSDLTTLLPSSAPAPTTAIATTTALPSLSTVVSSTSIAPAPIAPSATSTGPKRKTTNGSAPAPKRRKNAGSTATKKKAATGKPQAAKKSKNDTPNPLEASISVVPTSASIAAKVPPVKAVPKGVAPPPSVVTPATTAPPTAGAQPKSVTAPAPVPSTPPTEADFKSVAQAAVSNLVANASNIKGETTKGQDSTAKVDTSTDHVKALTGSNWVSVCGGSSISDADADTTNSTNPTAADKNNRARRQNLTADERARQNRDRNREHARNTRLRKKAYVEELKRTLTALVSQRDAAELEKRHASQRELEQREVRFRVTEEFLKLRGRNEANPARWAAILEDNFTLTLPVTEYREMVHSGDINNKFSHEQVLTGVSDIMRDSTLCSAFLQGLGKGHNDITLVYNCDRKNFFMDNCIAMLEFTATTRGAVQRGAIAEITMKGNVRAKFSPASNKLISLAMTFDTGSIMSQGNHIAKAGPQGVDAAAAAAAAAQVAANEADAILDSLQMPHIDPSSIPSKINVVPPSSGSTTGSDYGEKGESSDEDKDDGDENHEGMSTRRVLRRKD